jgi:hypothetical protein
MGENHLLPNSGVLLFFSDLLIMVEDHLPGNELVLLLFSELLVMGGDYHPPTSFSCYPSVSSS